MGGEKWRGSEEDGRSQFGSEREMSSLQDCVFNVISEIKKTIDVGEVCVELRCRSRTRRRTICA